MTLKKTYTMKVYLTVLIVLAVLVLSSILSISVGYLSNQSMKEKVDRSLAQTAKHMADKMDTFMWSSTGSLYTLASLEALKSLENPKEIEELINQLKYNFPAFSWIGVTDISGQVLASTEGILRGADISMRPVFVEGIKGQFIGDVHEAVLLKSLLPNPTGEDMKFVDISLPIINDFNQVVGVLAAHLDWKWAYDVKETLITPDLRDVGVELFIVSEQDQVVLLGPTRYIGEVYKLTDKEAIYNGSLINSTSKSDNIAYLESYHLSKGYLSMHDINWLITVRQPTSTAYEDSNRLQLIVWSIGIFGGIIFSVIGYYIADHFAKPILQLTTEIDKVRFGDTVLLPSFDRIYEFKKLSDTLQEMFDALNKNSKDIGFLSIAANHDPLTGLPNRAGLKHFIERHMDVSESLIVLSMDLDGFKGINDTYGHAAGDEVLIEVGKRLKQSVRDHEMVARIGGDEFVAVIIASDQVNAVSERVGNRIIEQLKRPFDYEGQTLHLGCSIGASAWQANETFDVVLMRSDEALYYSKKNGKNQLTIKND